MHDKTARPTGAALSVAPATQNEAIIAMTSIGNPSLDHRPQTCLRPGSAHRRLAIQLTDTGSLGKMFPGALEDVDDKQIDGLASTGAKVVHHWRFGVIPQITPVLQASSSRATDARLCHRGKLRHRRGMGRGGRRGRVCARCRRPTGAGWARPRRAGRLTAAP